MVPDRSGSFLQSGVFDKAQPRWKAPQRPHDDGRAVATAVPPGDMDGLLSIRTHLSRRLAPTYDAGTLYAVEAKGGSRSSAIIRKMPANRSHGMATFALRRSVALLTGPVNK